MTSAANPFMKTLRSSFNRAASPASPASAVSGTPSGISTSPSATAPGPLAMSGVRDPARGTGASTATSAIGRPRSAASTAISRLTWGAAVFMSAKTVGADASPRASPATSTATLAHTRLSTASAVRTASATPPTCSIPGSSSATFGSYPTTRAPASRSPRAYSRPASPSPRIAMVVMALHTPIPVGIPLAEVVPQRMDNLPLPHTKIVDNPSGYPYRPDHGDDAVLGDSSAATSGGQGWPLD